MSFIRAFSKKVNKDVKKKIVMLNKDMRHNIMVDCINSNFSTLNSNFSTLNSKFDTLNSTLNSNFESLIIAFNGYVGNVARSNDMEVTKAVYNFYRHDSLSFKLNFYLNSQERFIREIDGLVFLKNNEVALIEAKSSVTLQSIDQ